MSGCIVTGARVLVLETRIRRKRGILMLAGICVVEGVTEVSWRAAKCRGGYWKSVIAGNYD
ncbi:hypothetical protein KS4_25060 [Poriferisphaera corsica]|uniref:Uncharacterized protein n=1 Tax=Poriferisphaera corsica TaxID=2528020 RepID=A0A517YW51_9BACT|nr:hypothetical protein KS4_25060 [Poriferisphaera corsica]